MQPFFLSVIVRQPDTAGTSKPKDPSKSHFYFYFFNYFFQIIYKLIDPLGKERNIARQTRASAIRLQIIQQVDVKNL